MSYWTECSSAKNERTRVRLFSQVRLYRRSPQFRGSVVSLKGELMFRISPQEEEQRVGFRVGFVAVTWMIVIRRRSNDNGINLGFELWKF